VLFPVQALNFGQINSLGGPLFVRMTAEFI
jgi:hypothetical protein